MSDAAPHRPLMDDLERASRPVPVAPGLYELEVCDGWQQGRGAFGGLTLTALVRAIERFSATPDRSLRSLTAELPGAVTVGRAAMHVELDRAGSGQSTISAKLVQDGETRARATAVLAKPRAPDSATFCDLAPPAVRPYAETAPLPHHSLPPAFAQHFEFRTDGPFPFTGAKEALVLGWIRARNGGALRGAAALPALVDAYWPATFARATVPYPIATVAFTMQVVGDATDLDPSQPLAYRAEAWVQNQGWLVEQRELWSASGAILALNQQTVAVIK